MKRQGFWLQFTFTTLVLLSIGFAAYFGLPSPALLGLESSVGVALIVLGVGIAMYFLPVPLALLSFSLLILTVSILTFANWWHFQFFQGYFNYEFLAFLRDGDGALKSIGQYAYWSESGFLLLCSGLAILVFFFWKRNVIAVPFVVAHSGLSVIAGLLLLYSANEQHERLRLANALTLSPLYFHPVHAFLYPLKNNSQGELESWLKFKKMNAVEGRGKYLSQPIKEEKYNVIVLTLESFRASFVGAYGNNKNLTPEFDKMAASGVLFENFYANSNYTIKSENAIICGFFDHNARLSIAEFEGDKNLNCLPDILGEAGYNTFYMHANRGKFYNRKSHIPELGFDNAYFHADQFPKKEDGRRYIGWGLSDEDFFSLALQRLELDARSPFYAQIMSLSNHYPFQFDWPIAVPNELSAIEDSNAKTYAAYENAIYYSDYALGVFWRKFLDSALAENTILVVTGDHGVWSFDSDSPNTAVRRHEEYFRVPLLIYHPDIEVGYRVDQVASQIDIPVTLLDMLGVTYPERQFVGKNLFDHVRKPWSIMMKGGEVYVRLEDNICLPKKPMCGGPYQTCWSDTGVAEFIEEFGNQRCYRYSGDLLNGGEAIATDGTEGAITDAFGVVSYDNSRIFDLISSGGVRRPTHSTLGETAHAID